MFICVEVTHSSPARPAYRAYLHETALKCKVFKICLQLISPFVPGSDTSYWAPPPPPRDLILAPCLSGKWNLQLQLWPPVPPSLPVSPNCTGAGYTLDIISAPPPVSPSHCTPTLGCGLWSLCINAKSQGSAAACGNPFVLSYPPGAAQQRPANRHSDQIKSRDCTAVTAAASEMVSCSSPPRQANVTYLDFYWCSIGINYLY